MISKKIAVDTKERILDAAEQLFGDLGFKATSLRDITTEAGVNLASVNYHFGSKEALLGEVFDRRFAPVNESRLERLSEAEALPALGRAQVERIVRAFVSPLFEMLAERGDMGKKFLRLAGRIHIETDEIRVVLLKQLEPLLARFTAALQRALPDVEPGEVRLRILFLVGSMAYTMMWSEVITARPETARSPEDLLASLMQFVTAGMTAPSPYPAGVRARTRSGQQ